MADAQYAVQRKPLSLAPTDIPVSARPDVAVILGGTEADFASVISAWASPGPARPPSVVLVATPSSVDPVARMGGEESGILVRRCQVEDATGVAEKVRAAVSGNPCPIGRSSVTVWLSAGVACYPDHGTTAAEIFRARSSRRGQLVRVAHRQRRHVPGVIVSKE